MSQARHWACTVNNYTDADLLSSLPAGVKYLIYGKEVASSGTPHLQVHVAFDRPKRLSQVSRLFVSSGHWSVARNVRASIEYCKKDGDFVELGTPPSGERARNDLKEFMAAVKGGMYELSELREAHPIVVARFPAFVRDYIRDNLPAPVLANHPLRSWQSDLWNRLRREADPREIIFVVDPDGNAGKTWFAHYCARIKENVQVLIPGKKMDMAYQVQPTTRVFFIDAPRSKQGEFIQYDFLEELKNGYILSGKYESTHIRLTHIPHVIVLMNEEPDHSKLSADRYEVIEARNVG